MACQTPNTYRQERHERERVERLARIHEEMCQRATSQREERKRKTEEAKRKLEDEVSIGNHSRAVADNVVVVAAAVVVVVVVNNSINVCYILYSFFFASMCRLEQ